MSLDLDSPIPIYLQAAAFIRGTVAAGVYRSGEPIPSLRALAIELRLNPNTIQRAYEQLEREGIIESRKGLGMYVTKRGATSAKNKTETTVLAAFDRGIRTANEANMSFSGIRATFDKALSKAKAELKRGS